MRFIKVSQRIPVRYHNDVRLWALRKTDQDPKAAENLARSVMTRISKLPSDLREQALSEREINGWDGVAEWLDRLESGDHWAHK